MCDICYGYGLRSDDFDGVCPSCGSKICKKCDGYGCNGYNTTEYYRECDSCKGAGVVKLKRTYRLVSAPRARKLKQKGKYVRWYNIYGYIYRMD